MKPLEIKVGGAEILFNSLYENPDPALLMHDLLAVELADGYCIDVGWDPQFDPSGRYKVSILNADGLNIATVLETQDVHEAIEAVEDVVIGSEGNAPAYWSPDSASSSVEAEFPMKAADEPANDRRGNAPSYCSPDPASSYYEAELMNNAGYELVAS